ncbi:MAG: sigma 54-interacting transcriptional regulator [Myxococcales bacterium]|nr:sigma 54-interacting transcriptional regulator [Myxococcales bacterium]
MTRYLDIATSPRGIAAPSWCVAVFGDALRRYPLPVTGELVIGRAADCAIAIDDPAISRRHAAISITPEGITIRDLGSANGTTVRGVAIGAEPVRLVIDEIVQVGNVGLALQRFGGPRPARGTPPPSLSPMARVHQLLDLVASGTISVLILGETGVGKEVLADAVHRRSPRADRPFLRLNCAALSETLLESELFGYEKGAFTGAVQCKVGLLETAQGGTVFLDEIGELPMATQVKLLRVIEQREVMRVGGLAPRPIDVRFVAATHKDLGAEIADGRFRQDLYFRLNGITLTIPPLRERLGELDALAKLFVERTAAGLGKPAPAFTPDALSALHAHRWPGNIRELRNVIERAVLLAGGGTIEPEHVVLETQLARGSSPSVGPATPATHLESPPPPRPAPVEGLAALRAQTAAAEREQIVAALARAAGNQKVAAHVLGISRRTLLNKLDVHGIARPRKRAA